MSKSTLVVAGTTIAAIVAITLSTQWFIAATDDTSRPSEAKMLQLCREDTTVVGQVDEAVAAGWAYAGPLYNNGINCTVTLWVR